MAICETAVIGGRFGGAAYALAVAVAQRTIVQARRLIARSSAMSQAPARRIPVPSYCRVSYLPPPSNCKGPPSGQRACVGSSADRPGRNGAQVWRDFSMPDTHDTLATEAGGWVDRAC